MGSGYLRRFAFYRNLIHVMVVFGMRKIPTFFSAHSKTAREIRKVFEYRKRGIRKMLIKRGDVFYADLDPIIGSEQGGIRPVLVVQNNVGNKYSPTVVVLPISSAKKNNMPTHIHICGSKMMPKDSIVLAEQIRTIDRNRLLRYVGSVSLEIMEKVDRAVKISIGVKVND